MKKYLKIIISFIIFSISIIKLKAELSSINFKDVLTTVQDRSLPSIIALITVSFLSIWVLSLYDYVLVKSQKLDVPLMKTIKVSWIINSLNALIGFGGVIGSTIRYNYFQNYTQSDEEKNDLKKNISLMLISMLTGLAVLSFFVVFDIFSPSYLLAKKPILKITLFILVILLPIFLLATTIKPPVPRDRYLSLKYTLVSVLDYFSVSLVMFLSLKFVGVQVDFWHMETVFIIAAIAGLISMVPGGLGAFDVIFLLGMTHQFDLKEGPILLALVFYRLTYYILPFLLGLILSISELQYVLKDKNNESEAKPSSQISLFTKEFGTILIDITKKRVQVLIRWAIIALFVLGNLFFLQDAFFGIFAISSAETNVFIFLFATIYLLASFYLIPNYVGLYYGSKETFKNLLILLSLIVISQIVLFNQLFFIEGFIFSFILLLVLFLARNNFPVQLTIRYRKEKAIWFITLISLMVCLYGIYQTASLFDFYLFKNFGLYCLGLSLSWFAYILIHRYYLRHQFTFAQLAEAEDMSSDTNDYEEVITSFSGGNLANLGFLPANNVLVHQKLNVACIYQENNYSILILGDPVGNTDNFFPFINLIHDYATNIGKELIFYQTSTDYIHIYTEFKYHLFNLGEEAEVAVNEFKITGNKGKSFRQLLNKQQNEALTFQIEEASESLIKELQPISDEWLGDRKEMSFSLGSFDESYLLKQDIATIRNSEGEAIAFASMMPAYVDGKISIDLIRWKEHPSIPMMDLLYLHLILWAQENDYQIFNLGMSPLSRSFTRDSGLLSTIITSVYQNSSSLYSFKGLRNYKNKFKPKWAPRYLVFPRRLPVSEALLISYKNIHPRKKEKSVSR